MRKIFNILVEIEKRKLIMLDKCERMELRSVIHHFLDIVLNDEEGMEEEKYKVVDNVSNFIINDTKLRYENIEKYVIFKVIKMLVFILSFLFLVGISYRYF